MKQPTYKQVLQFLENKVKKLKDNKSTGDVFEDIHTEQAIEYYEKKVSEYRELVKKEELS